MASKTQWTEGKANLNGANDEKGSGYGRQRMAGTQPAEQGTQPADAPSGTGLKTHGPQMAGLAANKQQLPQMTSACRAGKWGECSGTGSHEGGCRPTYRPYPTYCLCLSLSLPTPLICTNPIWPQINFFFFRFYFYPLLPTMIRPLTPFNVLVRLT